MADKNLCPLKTRRKSIAGQRFGKLTALEEVLTLPKLAAGYTWRCLCDCGKGHLAPRNYLVHGKATSCGCTRRKAAKPQIRTTGSEFGPNGRNLYLAWERMRSRCRIDPLYVGRVSVCKRWDSFSLFAEDMGASYLPGLSLDRFPDNNGNYEPGNCRWTDAKSQARNTRRNHLVTFRGETKCLAEWAGELGIHPETLRRKLTVHRMPMESIV